MALALGLVFRAPDFTCPSSHMVLLSSLCSPLHLSVTHIATFLDPVASWKSGGPGQAGHRCLLTSPSGFYLRLPGSEGREVCMNFQVRSIEMVLHAVGLCLSGALEKRSQSLPQPNPILWHLLTKLTFHSRNQRITLGLIIHHTTTTTTTTTLHLVNPNSPNATRISSLTATLLQVQHCRLLQRHAQALPPLPRILG